LKYVRELTCDAAASLPRRGVGRSPRPMSARGVCRRASKVRARPGFREIPRKAPWQTTIRACAKAAPKRAEAATQRVASCMIRLVRPGLVTCSRAGRDLVAAGRAADRRCLHGYSCEVTGVTRVLR